MYCPECKATDKVVHPHKLCIACDRRIRKETEIMWKHHSLDAHHKAQRRLKINWYQDNRWSR